MFRRAIHERLEAWMLAKDRKPLVLRGARQVGKTVAVKMFGERFDRFICMNLDLTEDADLFRRNLNVKDLYQAILLKQRVGSTVGKTLLFLDEIQNCPEAVNYLRYFYEMLSHIYVIAAGSLLEIALQKKHIEFPVGRVEHLFMHPLSFREFLVAVDAAPVVAAYEKVPVESFACPALFGHFHRYALIGGMPEVVARYVEKQEVAALKPVYDALATSYFDDAAKYARNSSMAAILRHCIESAPMIAGQRIKFAGFGSSNYGSREVGEALRTLQRAMLIHLLHPCTMVEPPVMPDLKKSPRLQFLDTGLLNCFAGLQSEFFQHTDLHGIYRGILAEHIVGQELLCLESGSRKKPCFWVRDKTQSQAEVDFVVQHGRFVIPVEVKSGKAGSLRSLHEFMGRCPHRYAVRFYSGPCELHSATTPAGKAYDLLNLPYFLAGLIHEYIDWMIQNKS